MCGLFFVANADVFSPNDLRQASSLIAHRGPDDQTCKTFPEGIFASHSALRLTGDQSVVQPYESNSLIVVFNGEIYNYRELYKEFQEAGTIDYRGPVTSECDFLNRAFPVLGAKLFDKIDGMFAVVIIERETGRITLARDRFGQKPLYYAMRNSALVVSSEICPILRLLGDVPRPNEAAVFGYFSARVWWGEESYFQSIYQVNAGTVVTFESKRGFQKTVYQYSGSDTEWNIRPGKSEADVQYLRDALKRAVVSTSIHVDQNPKEHASLLSCGIDSSAIAYFLRQAEMPPTFYAYAKKATLDDEGNLAAAIAKKHGMHCNVVSGGMSWEAIKEVARTIEIPMYATSSLPLYLLFKQIREVGNHRVVLSGDGADELFLGYSQNLDRDLDWNKYFGRVGLVPPALLPQIFSRATEFDVNGILSLVHADAADAHTSARWFELKARIPEYHALRLDRLSMAFGLELRLPFLRREVVEASFAVTTDAHFGDLRKPFLREALRGVIPEEIADRDKERFSPKTDDWQLDIGLSDSVLLQGPNAEELSSMGLNIDGVRQILSNDSTPAKARIRWGLVNLLAWHQTFYNTTFSLQGH